MNRWFAGLMISLGLAAGLSACSAQSVPPPTGKIAFEVEFGVNRFDLFVVNADGSHRERLTNNNFVDVHPAWSPDGRRLAFASNRDGNFGIYMMNADGSQPRALTRNVGATDDFSPTWSPDGKHIAFISWRDENWELHVMEVGDQGLGSNVTRLTFNNADDIDPKWSPDGRRLAFASMRDGNWELYMMDTACFAEPDTCDSRVTRLTDHPAIDLGPEWSPDGQQLAWYSNRVDEILNIYVMTLADKRPKRLTIWSFHDTNPTWSPDGQYIAFHSFRDNKDDIYVMRADGTAPVLLTGQDETDDNEIDGNPVWQP